VGSHETAKGQGVNMPSDIDQGPCLSTNQNQVLFLALVIVSPYFFDISKQFPFVFILDIITPVAQWTDFPLIFVLCHYTSYTTVSVAVYHLA